MSIDESSELFPSGVNDMKRDPHLRRDMSRFAQKMQLIVPVAAKVLTPRERSTKSAGGYFLDMTI
jgi:hypothetical protein